MTGYLRPFGLLIGAELLIDSQYYPHISAPATWVERDLYIRAALPERRQYGMASRMQTASAAQPQLISPRLLGPLRLARRVAGGIARRVETLERRIDPDVARSSHREAVVHIMNEYNMVTKPDEPYYAQQYLHFILPMLERRFPHRGVTILDLGCGQGRLSLPLAQWCARGGGTVTGVDLTSGAVVQAEQYASAQAVHNVTFVNRDAVEFVREAPDSSADAIVFTEVTFFMPAYREALKDFKRLLKPGGVSFVAFRSQYYDLLQLASTHSWENAKRCLAEREGNIYGGPLGFAWQTVEDIHRQLDDVGLRILQLFGIGVLSGIECDARSAIIQPSRLSPQDQRGLMEVECAAAEKYAECGRYILTIAERKNG